MVTPASAGVARIIGIRAVDLVLLISCSKSCVSNVQNEPGLHSRPGNRSDIKINGSDPFDSSKADI